MVMVALMALTTLGCPYLSEDELVGRMDMDGDGVPRPEDCDDYDPGVGDAESLFFDSDGDGFGSAIPAESCAAISSAATNSDDCDDNDQAVFPGAEESCNGEDNDCNGTIDDVEPLPSWYADADGDGYGNGQASPLSACDQPSGYVANGDDCDDLNPGAFPDTKEVCDDLEVDEDCSGAADDADPNVDPETQVTLYQDEDGDGFGVDEVSTEGCHAEDGWAVEAGDCDDSDAERHPDTWWYRDRDEDEFGDVTYGVRSCLDVDGYVRDSTDCDDERPDINPAGQEVCDDADADEDCDGDADDEDDTVADQHPIYQDDDGDGFGLSSKVQLSCETPSGWAQEPDDCDDGEAAVNPGRDEELFCTDGMDNDCDGLTDCDDPICSQTTTCGYYDLGGVDAVLQGSWNGDAGSSVDGAGDHDGDGVEDFLVGMPVNINGTAFVVSGTTRGSGILTKLAYATISGVAANDHAGAGVAGIGDVDDDGFADIAIGAIYSDEAGADHGAVYLLHGPVSGALSLSTAAASYHGLSAGDYLGDVISGGVDLDGDNIADLVVGDQANASVYLIPFPSGDASISQDAWVITGAYAGGAMSVGGDNNGDGQADLLVGATSSNGGATLLLGPVTSDVDLGSSASAEFTWSSLDTALGNATSLDGDVNGDGFDDVLIGARWDDSAGWNAGAAHLFLGPCSGTLAVSAATATFEGEASQDVAGDEVELVQDIDGDGFSDILVAAPDYDESGVDDGAAYVLFGPVTGVVSLGAADVVMVGEGAGEHAGESITALDDVDGDGRSELLLGAPNAASADGAVYLVLGAGF